MKVKKLVSMTEHVNEVLDYVHESHNHKRGIELIDWYAKLIAEPLSLEMFQGLNPLFPNFQIVQNQGESIFTKSAQSVFTFGKNEFGITLYRKSKHSTGLSGMCFISSFHLKTIEDLCAKDLMLNTESEYAKIYFEEPIC